MRVLAIVASLIAPLGLIIPSTTIAHEAGDIILRIGAASVSPDTSSSLIASTNTGALAGTAVSVGDDTQFGLNIVYMMTDNIGFELLASSPFEHDLSASGLEQYGFSTTDIGSTTHVPPTLKLNYFFGDSNSQLRPYLGVGLNYTAFFDDSLSNQARLDLGASNLELDNSYGVAFGGGIDYKLNDNWLLNASVWNIDIDTQANFNSSLGRVSVDAEIDPWVYMISLGYRF